MDTARIAALLQPYLDRELSTRQLEGISMYIDILLKWNARINLTAIRDPEEIVTRHFGESLFLGRHVLPQSALAPTRVVDLGSGAGFPGLPLKIWAPQIHLTLVESNQKKVAFLREVSRALTLTDINVYPGRAETLVISPKSESPSPSQPSDSPITNEESPSPGPDLVTFRAVEKFDQILPVATALLSPFCRLAVLIGSAQLASLSSLQNFSWQTTPLPQSNSRLLVLGTKLL